MNTLRAQDGNRDRGRSLTWPGSAKPIPEEDLWIVVSELEPGVRDKLRLLSEAVGADEVSVLIWLLSDTGPPNTNGPETDGSIGQDRGGGGKENAFPV